jgi:hypothetical protein
MLDSFGMGANIELNFKEQGFKTFFLGNLYQNRTMIVR